jgi:hypothetical protein
VDIKKTQKTCWRLQILDLSMFVIVLKHLISWPYIPPIWNIDQHPVIQNKLLVITYINNTIKLHYNFYILYIFYHVNMKKKMEKWEKREILIIPNSHFTYIFVSNRYYCVEKRAFNESVVIPIMHQTNLRTYLTQKYTSTLPNLIIFEIKHKKSLHFRWEFFLFGI